MPNGYISSTFHGGYAETTTPSMITTTSSKPRVGVDVTSTDDTHVGLIIAGSVGGGVLLLLVGGFAIHRCRSQENQYQSYSFQW